MLIWILTFLVFMVVILLMVTGYWLLKRPIAGSCGGLNKLGMKEDCAICGAPYKKSACKNRQKQKR